MGGKPSRTWPVAVRIRRVYTVDSTYSIDLDLLDYDDPFEIDDANRPHLAKHHPFTEEDVFDVFFGDPVFAPAEPPAELLMIGPVPGEILVVPLVPAASPTQVRPIGVYRASPKHLEVYEDA